MKKTDSQVIQNVLITPYTLEYTNKKGEKISKKLVAFIGANSKAILSEFREAMSTGKATFSGYIEPAHTGAPANAKKLAESWTSPKTGKKFSTCKGWIVDPELAPTLSALLTPQAVKTLQDEQAAKDAKKAEKQAVKAESGKAVKVAPKPGKDGAGAVALVANAVKQYGDFKKIPGAVLTSLNNICEASGISIKDARILASLS